MRLWTSLHVQDILEELERRHANHIVNIHNYDSLLEVNPHEELTAEELQKAEEELDRLRTAGKLSKAQTSWVGSTFSESLKLFRLHLEKCEKYEHGTLASAIMERVFHYPEISSYYFRTYSPWK